MKIIKSLFILIFAFTVSPSYAQQMLDNNNIIIFVSFSMPDESLKTWMREAKLINAPVVVRGFINNSFKETVNKISLLAKDNHGGVQIDPTLFQRFQIQKVPAVVVINKDNCMTNMSCINNFDVIYGDITLSHALEKLSNKEDDNTVVAKKYLQQLRELSNV